MNFCKYCGVRLEQETDICPACGRYIGPPKPLPTVTRQPAPAQAVKITSLPRKKLLLAIGVGAAAVILIVALLALLLDGSKCDYSGCGNKPVAGYKYCYSHKCSVSTCDKSQTTYSNYCYSHYLIYDDDATSYSSGGYSGGSSKYVASYELNLSSAKVSSGSLYTYAEGTLRNNSDYTVKFVKIKGSFKNSSGSVIDTDWTYAVGAEGLAPGESCKWKMSVPKDYAIRSCSVSILDYDY